MKKTTITNRTPIAKNTHHGTSFATVVMFLGLALTLLSAIAVLMAFIDYKYVRAHDIICADINPMLMLGNFAWAIIPAGALLCTIAINVPVLRFLRRHPIFLYATLSAVSIASMVHYSMSVLGVLQFYFGINAYLAATMLAVGAYVFYAYDAPAKKDYLS